MGVHGLWRLLDASGKPVPLETLEGKILAIDVSIWIHQVLQGYQDHRGSAVPNAHLLGLFHRICKLLYFKIRPVFVFDGGVPVLKKNTIASRKKQKAIASSKVQQMKHDLIQNLIKRTAVKGALGDSKQSTSQGTSDRPATSRSTNDMFALPNLPAEAEMQSDENLDDYENSEDELVELSPRKQSRWRGNIHNVDVTSDDFKALPADVRFDVLTDLKETRKQNSWGRLHEMPSDTHDFSSYQMNRLLKRRKVQECLEEAEKEMGGRTMTLEELEKLLSDQGVDTRGRDTAYRIASDSTTRLIYIDDPKGLARKNSEEDKTEGETEEREEKENSRETNSEPGTSKSDDEENSSTQLLIADMNEYDLDDEWESDDEIIVEEKVSKIPREKKLFGKQSINPALAYMLENAGLSQEQIFALLDGKKSKVSMNDELLSTKKNAENERTKVVAPPETESEHENSEPSTSKLSNFDLLLTANVRETKNVDQTELVDNLEYHPCETSNSSPELVDISESNVAEISNSSSEMDDSRPKIIDGSASNPTKTESLKSQIIENVESNVSENSRSKNNPISSDSDTDSDLIEIPDVPIPEINSGLEIMVKPNEAPNDDIFADVFFNESQSVSDISARDISNTQESSANASFPEIEEISEQENEKEKVPVEDSPVPKIATEIQPEKMSDDPPTIISTEKSSDVNSTSSLQIDKLSEEIDNFKPNLLKATPESLASMQAELDTEHSDLTENIGKMERQALAVTDQMRLEAQDLLRLFGIPYIVAPMEAEAQCAYLESIELTDGTVTDDSDIWLFGGRCVYKNFFNNSKRVMEYKSVDIEHHFKLTRQQMIQLALLVGSDYTVGVSGIGPVTALEILAAFPNEGDDLLRGLASFSSWIRAGRSVGPGRATLRNKLRNVQIEKGFPSQAVVQAYLFPTVDESKESFTWSKPNLTLLADYTRQKFGWTRLKFEETIGPVVKKLAEAKSQKSITSYFGVSTVPKSIETTLSKRVQKAVKRLGNVAADDETEGAETSGNTKESKKRKGKKSKMAKSVDPSDESKNAPDDENLDLIDESVDSTNSASTQVCEEKTSKGKTRRIPEKVDEFIPQREKDKLIAKEKKLHAIEIFKKSKKSSGRAKRPKRHAGNVQKQINLSESSDSN